MIDRKIKGTNALAICEALNIPVNVGNRHLSASYNDDFYTEQIGGYTDEQHTIIKLHSSGAIEYNHVSLPCEQELSVTIDADGHTVARLQELVAQDGNMPPHRDVDIENLETALGDIRAMSANAFPLARKLFNLHM